MKQNVNRMQTQPQPRGPGTPDKNSTDGSRPHVIGEVGPRTEAWERVKGDILHETEGAWATKDLVFPPLMPIDQTRR